MTAAIWTIVAIAAVAIAALYFAVRFSVAWMLRKPRAK